MKQLFVQAQQNMDDFLNEVVLVAAMKHRNLVKLKGCCLRKDQRLLVYEYVESGDVAQVIFGELDATHVTRHASDLTNMISLIDT